MKRGWRVLAILGVCAGMALLAAVLWPREREPEYNGKTLSEWLFVYMEAHAVNNGAGMEVSSHAVRQIGTNGLPWMMRWISSYEPGRLRQIAAKLPSPFDRIARYRDGELRRAEALWGFGILESLGRPVVTQLTDWANNRTRGWSQRQLSGMLALAAIGYNFEIPRLVKQLADPEERLRQDATNELMRIAPELLGRKK